MSQQTDIWVSRIGLALIFSYSFIASRFYSSFAKIHLTIKDVDFPIFLSEILLFICFFCFVWICRDGRLLSRRVKYILILYFGWVLVKALINYYYDGPLTFRNAALFYYPIFAVFGYFFYRMANISRDIFVVMVFVFAVVLFFRLMGIYYWWTYVLLFVISLRNIKSERWKWAGWAFLGLILLSVPEFFYRGSRSHFISVLGAGIFLLFFLGSMFYKNKRFLPFFSLVFMFFVFIFGFFIFATSNTITSLTSFDGMAESYKLMNDSFRVQEKNYVPRDIPVQLYNGGNEEGVVVRQPRSELKIKVQAVRANENTLVNTASDQKNIMVKTPKTGGMAGAEPKFFKLQSAWTNIFMIFRKDNIIKRINDERTVAIDEDNIVFRFFVWRDMILELFDENAWFGFSFGHPQRSKSLEVLHWAESEWGRDGWITPHNSFLHVIYRSGIIGLFFLGAFIYFLVRLIRDFLNKNSLEGGLLISILIYWIILANFLVILEFPYNAILFWSLFGITAAYRDHLKESF